MGSSIAQNASQTLLCTAPCRLACASWRCVSGSSPRALRVAVRHLDGLMGSRCVSVGAGLWCLGACLCEGGCAFAKCVCVFGCMSL